jgi:hypothetical protein
MKCGLARNVYKVQLCTRMDLLLLSNLLDTLLLFAFLHRAASIRVFVFDPFSFTSQAIDLLLQWRSTQIVLPLASVYFFIIHGFAL